MKTNIFFILVALLVLGYLHLLTKYAQRIDHQVIHHQQIDNQPQQQQEQRNSLGDSRQQQQSSSSTLISQPRLSAKETRHQQQRASQPVVPIVQRLPGGNPIPNDKDEIQQLDLDDPTVRGQRVVYVITPTYRRITQRVDLTRLRQTLQLASLTHHAMIYWIILEDAPACSQAVRTVAEESGLAFAHKAIQYESGGKSNNNGAGHRGLTQRNAGLDTVVEVGKEGVVYFADDDNGYDIQLFTELTYTRHASIFAVGLSGGSAYERCHVNEATGKVDAILSTWKPRYRVPTAKGSSNKQFTRPQRKFGMDMAGFAFSTTALVTTQARFSQKSTSGMLETDFLSLLGHDVSELEPLAANCTRILAWHVKTIEPQWYNNPEPDGEATFELIKSML